MRIAIYIYEHAVVVYIRLLPSIWEWNRLTEEEGSRISTCIKQEPIMVGRGRHGQQNPVRSTKNIRAKPGGGVYISP